MSAGTVAIVGAGPYGLSLAANLASRGIAHRIFGRPMQFWERIAHAGGERYLKSFCFGTSLVAPTAGFTFADYNGARGLETFEPCSMMNFVNYGRWFQQAQAPWVEHVDVGAIEEDGGRFVLSLTNGETFEASRVVIATGLRGFETLPSSLATLPPDKAVHTSGIKDFAEYRGRSVAVVGAGQSALEAAALLLESGARPHLLTRTDRIKWQTRTFRRRSLWRTLRSPISGLGSGPKAWALVHFPGLVHRAPERWRVRFVERHLPPEGAWWLRPRVDGKVATTLGVAISAARATACGVELDLRNCGDGQESPLRVDCVVAGTGYVVDVDRLNFLSPGLRRRIDRIQRAPRLDAGFESSVPGLFFVGPSAAMSFGPLFRFVVGTAHATRTICARLAS